MEWPISISSYARLFMAQMLPQWCQKVIYLDCDTIVCDCLQEMWQTDMCGKSVAGVMDLVLIDYKQKVGLRPEDVYINAGVLLVDLEYWRQHQIQD